MRQFLLLFARRPWLWLGLLLVVSLLAATQLDKLRVRVSADEMLVIDDPQRSYYRQVEQLFGEQRVMLVVMEDRALLEPEYLAILQRVIGQLEALPFVERTESLFNIPYVKSVDGFLDKTPYLANLPADAEQGRALLDAAIANPLLRNVLVAPNGRSMAVAVILSEATDTGDDEMTAAVARVIEPLQAVYEKAYAIGFVQVRSELAARIMDEQAHLLPLAIGALLITLFLMLRQLLDIVTPLMTAAISILWTFGLMGWLGIPVNVVTSTIPILLIVVGSTLDIHLLAEFRYAQRCSKRTAVALAQMARKMGRTVLLTFVTTYAGFLSVGLSGIQVLRDFGLVASTGLLFNFLVSIVFIPSILALAGHWHIDGGPCPFERQRSDWADHYWRWLVRHRWSVALVVILVAIIAASGIPRIRINHNPVESLGDHSQVARNIERLNSQYAGLESFSIVIDSGIQDTFLHARYLDEVVRLQRFVKDLEPSLSVTSFADYLALLNNALLEDPRAGPPRTNDEIAELMLFLDHARVSAYVTGDYSHTRIVVRHAITAEAQLAALFGRIRAYIDSELDRGLRARLTGDSVLSISATRGMIDGQLKSILLIVTFFVLLISFIFTDLRVGLLAALPNVFPVVVLFGFMGYAEIPLNVGTTMAAAIAIGIAVDDTLHLMLRYNLEMRHSKSQTRAMQNALREEALPVFSTSLALITGFLVFAQSEFGPVAQFGLLSALVILVALFADFIITPLTMASLRLVTLWDLLSSRMRRQVIPNSPMFRGMRPWQIRKFVLSSTLLDFAPGAYVYRVGDDSQAMYLVIKGVVEITVPPRTPEGRAAVVDEFGSGQVFGDVAMLAEERRKTNAVALTHTTLMVLSRESIINVTNFHPFTASRLFLNLARDVSCRWVRFIVRVRTAQDSRPDPEDRA